MGTAAKKEEIKIRRMREFDLPMVKDIDKELAGPNRVLSWQIRIEAHWWTYRRHSNFVAEVGDKVVGFILGDVRGSEYGAETSGWIDMMGVIPRYQNLGIGRKLIEAFCEECRKNKVAMRIAVKKNDKRLIQFLTSLGFQTGNMVTYEKADLK